MNARTRLRFEPARTCFEGGSATPTFGLAIGPCALADRYWRDGVPTPMQVEQAIDDVETAVMNQGLAQGARGRLVTDDAALRRVPALQHDGALLDRDDVEALFDGLASAVLSDRGALAPAEAAGEAAAALLILRECMHHLGFDAIEVRTCSWPEQP